MKKLIIVGKSCSGKTELAMSLKERGYKLAVTCTSRPKRPSEENGVHYHFVTRDEFEDLIKRDWMVEWDEFNNWYYGLPSMEFINSEVFIVTPRGIETLIRRFGRDKMFIMFLDTPEEIRLERSHQRGDDPDEVHRRYWTDQEDFVKFIFNQDWDLRLDYRGNDHYKTLLDLFSSKKELIASTNI